MERRDFSKYGKLKDVTDIEYAMKYDCGIEIPLKNICGIDVGLIEKSIPVYQKEMVKCFGMALAGGLVYLLAESLSKE